MNDTISFDDACSFLERSLKGETRPQILAPLLKSKNFKEALIRLRDSMRSHLFKAGGIQLHELQEIVRTFDRRTAQDGFHVLQDWDGKAAKLNEEIIPVDVLHFFMTTPREGPANKTVLAVLLDYYFIYVLAMFCLRSWDEGNANENLERVTGLIDALQGPNGSGHQFARNAETLILVATSHFEPDEKAYDRLLARVKDLEQPRQVNLALSHAAILGSHLRHGFQDLYGRDLTLMRNDNGPDYPWLCFSVLTLMRAYSRMRDEGRDESERRQIVEGILNGLTADARAFLGKTPAPLAAVEADFSEFRQLFSRYKDDLIKEIEWHRPSDENYSPLSFNFNFPHNLVKAAVIDALLESEGLALTINDLLTGLPRAGQVQKDKQALASTLMRYARFIPDQIRNRAVPVISYDPRSGLLSYAKTATIIKEFSAASLAT